MSEEMNELIDNISYIVNESKKEWIEPLGLSKETWEQLLQYIDKLEKSSIKYKSILDKIKEIVNEMPYLWYVDEEIERIDGTIELKYKEYDTSKLEELLEEIE